ncbi:MAG: ABC transporter permease, partial [Abitibacteriaceae bacterium]|nr:ABC transporter permease [Abditibacteriaceae bacterium]
FTALAANVSSLETFWTPRRARKRRAIGAALFLGLVVFFFGYGWDLLIINSTLAMLLRRAPLSSDWALAALWTLALVVGTLIASASIEAAFKRFYQDEISLNDARRTALAGMLRSFILAIGTYFLFCWIGGLRGVNGVWAARLAPTLGTAVAYALADFGTSLLQAVVPERTRESVRTLRALWIYGLPLLTILLIVWDGHLRLSFGFEQAPIVLLSPLVTLLSLFRFELTRPSAPWWWGPLAQVAIGSVCLAIALGYQLHTATANELATPTATEAHWSDALTAPLRLLNKFLRKVAMALLNWLGQVNQTLREWNEWIVQRGIKYDNAVLTAELRRRVQREYWLLQWPMLLLFEAGAFLLIADPGVLVGLTWQNIWTLPINYQAWGTGVVIGVLIVALVIAVLSTFALGQAFDREHANGTLLFLFLTPMTDAAILLGKFVPGVFYSGLLLSTSLPWLLFGCLAGMAGGSLIPLGIAGLGLFFILASWLFAACLQTLCAIYANKPTEGMAVAIVAGFMIESICWGLIAVVQIWVLDTTGLRFEGSIMVMWFLVMSLVHLALAYVAWRLSLQLLRRQRYGDVLAKSTRLLRILADKLAFIRLRSGGRTSPRPHDASL